MQVGQERSDTSCLSARNQLGGALLLVGFPTVDLVRLHGIPVVFQVVDLTAGGILLAIDLLALPFGELATIRLATPPSPKP